MHPVSDSALRGITRRRRRRLTTDSGFVAACPKLTEVTIFPDPYNARITETGILCDPDRRVLSAMSELVVACNALPDFDTLQILHFSVPPHHPICWCEWERCRNHILHVKQREQSLREQARDMKDFAINCLKSKTGCREGEGRKRITVRVVRLNSALPRPDYYPGSVEVEEYEV